MKGGIVAASRLLKGHADHGVRYRRIRLQPGGPSVAGIVSERARATTAVSDDLEAVPGNGQLTADQVKQLSLPDVSGEDDAPQMPTGDFSSLLAAGETNVDGGDPPPAPDVPAQEDLAGETGDLPVVERDELSTTYERKDGSQIRQVSMDPINLETDRGWREISTELEKTPEGGWAVEEHPLAPEFQPNANAQNAVTVTGDGHAVGFTLEGVGNGTPEIAQAPQSDTNDTLTYNDVTPTTDLEYVIEKGAIKEALILHEPPSTSTWSWVVDAGSLTPKARDSGLVDFVDKDGSVVMHVPAPVAWDSSGKEGQSADDLINPAMKLTHIRGALWKYSISIERAWLSSPERVYPVNIDPTIQRGPSYANSFKSDGATYNNQLHVGNTRQNNQNVFWRALASYNYGDVPGKFINEAQMLLAYDGVGTTENHGGEISHARCLGYNCIGDWLTNYSVGGGQTATSGDAIKTRLASRFAQGDTGVTFLIRGNECACYSYKRLSTEMFIEYWPYPTVAATSPGDGSTGVSLTPTLTLDGQGYSPYSTPSYWFKVSTNPDMSSPVWESGWIDAKQATVPEGKLQADTTYYWQGRTIDGHNGQGGQSTDRWSGVWNLKTQKVPATPPVLSASPGNAVGVAQTLTTLTPTLQVDAVTDPDGIPSNGTVTYEFKLATGPDGKSGGVFSSGLIPAAADGRVRWTVPPGTLQDGGTYSWIVQPHDGLSKNTQSPWVKKFKIDMRLGATGPSPFDSASPVTVNMANGNANLSFSSPTVETVGGPMGMSFTYNSQAVRASTQGLTGSYYDARDNAGNAPGSAAGYSFDGKSPLVVRTDPTISFNWDLGSPGGAVPSDQFLARWAGFIRVPSASARWRFGVKHDDGTRLRVGNQTVVDKWQHGDAPIDWSGDLNLGTSQSAFQLDFFEGVGNAAVELWADDMNDATGPVLVPASWLSKRPTVLPEGWSASTPIAGDSTAWSSAVINESAIILTDASGAAHTYTRQSAGGYTPPSGEYGTASLDGTGRVVFTDEDGTVYQFSNTGLVESATSTEDGLKPSAPISIRDSLGRVVKLADPASKDGSSYRRSVDFVYFNGAESQSEQNCKGLPPAYFLPPEGMLCAIKYPNGTQTDLYYGPNESLWLIEDPGAERTWFGYNDRILTSIEEPATSDYILSQPSTPSFPTPTVDIAYADNRVSAVTQPSPNGTAARQKKIYTYDATKRTSAVSLGGVAGSTSTVTYDEYWRQLSASSPMGVSSSTQWHPTKDLTLSATDSKNLKTTTLYDPITDRVVHEYGPAPAACFTSGGMPVSNPSTAPGCGQAPGHSSTSYDSGLKGLNAAYYSGTQHLSGQPRAFSLGLNGNSSGTVDRDWGTAAPAAGVTADNFSLRLTGLVSFPETGQYTFRTTSDDGVRVWLDDVLIIDQWTAQLPTDSTAQAISVTAGEARRIRIEYFEVDLSAMLQLKWATPSQAGFTIVPGSSLRPDYGLPSTTTVDDSAPSGITGVSNALVPSVKTSNEYEYPWMGHATSSVVDPGGLNLRTSTAYESPESTGWSRRLSRTLPAGTSAGAPATAKSSNKYWGDLESAPNVCGVGGVPQFGLLKTDVGATPASGVPVTTDYVYDVMGRTAGSKATGDTDWSCTTYSSSGDVETETFFGGMGVAPRTVKTATVPASEVGERETVSDGAVVGSPNGSTITTVTNLAGQIIKYEDVWGTVTVPSYDPLTNRLQSTTTTYPGSGTSTTAFTYDADGKVTSIKVNNEVLATPAYDATQQLASVSYFGGAKLASITRDKAAWLTGMSWTFPSSVAITDTVVRSQAGRIIQNATARSTVTNLSTFGYDAAGRLVTANIPSHELSYGFSSTGGCGTNAAAGASGNRSSLTDSYTAPGSSSSSVTKSTYCYDWSDRLTSSSVTGAVAGAHAVADGLTANEVTYDTAGNLTRLADMTY
ncbi:hypothetical protein MAFF212519_23980 [Clavibacter michiganensis]